jgi:hypothetical protein
VRLGRYECDEDGTIHTPTSHDLALLRVPYPTGEKTVTALNRRLLLASVGEMARQGEVTLHFRYLSEGTPKRPEEFAALYG